MLSQLAPLPVQPTLCAPMPTDRFFIYLATACFFGGFAFAFLALRQGMFRPSRWHLVVMAAGFICQLIFLEMRGKVIRQCPVTNQFELLVFVAWSMVLLYFLIGTAYRWSLLGMFTAPLVLLLQLMALLAPDPLATPPAQVNPWNELHKTVSLLSYGAFALSCVAGVMFLVQDRQLKKHQLRTLFYHLPPIHYLHKVLRRLNWFGLILLTLGILSAYKVERVGNTHSLVAVYLVWAIYAAIIFYDFTRGMSARKGAIASVLAFIAPIITLWIFSR
jgi:HemX protein